MKKQILLLIVAFMASITVSWAQDVADPANCFPAQKIEATCLDLTDGKKPVAGVEYLYHINVPSPTSGDKSYNWFITNSPSFITTDGSGNRTFATALPADGTDPRIIAAGRIDATEGTGSYNNDSDNGTNKIYVTWNYFVPDPNNPIFLVIYVENVDDCTNDNIEVFIIEPVHSFTLDIAALDANGLMDSTNPAFVHPCAAPIASAIWDPTDREVKMNYGINYLFFTVTAANFNHSWMPSFEVSGDGIDGNTRGRKATAIEWRYPGSTTWTGVGTPVYDASGGPVGTSGVYKGTSTAPVTPQGGTTAVGAAGECIIVRVTIDNGYVETIETDDRIYLAVDGIMYDATDGLTDRYATAALGDVHHLDHPTDPTNNCLWVDEFTNDVASQLITIRPDIDEVTPLPFEPKEEEED